ncbi:lamin tail domain-containing protein [Corallococcus exiguus]|uniref:lamin tail domain-containing protein n=1 Tax=Corallococcus exiguus TaxID=83462 RepID=UPI0014724800|nr:lamin tail domain-containing protein [Corallococcus exiguus]NNB88307.1 hypothetical protein [Corallococcus exiguus]
MDPRIAVLARCLGLSVLCLGLSLGCTEPGVSPQPPPAGVVDAAASTVVVDRPTGVLANGQDTAVITVTALRKTDGSPLSGLAVSLTVEGEGASILESAAITDITGVARARVTSTVPGVKTVKASVTDDLGRRVPLTATATVDFADVNTVKTLAFRSALPDGVAGVPLQGLVVEVRNGAGAVVTDSTVEVTLSPGSGGSVVPEGLLTVAAVNGVATFPDVVLTKAGEGYHFSANAPGFEPVASTVFTVAPGAVSALGVDRILDTATAGAAEALEITLADMYANTATNYTGTVTLTSTDAAATLPSHTFTAADAGRFKFQGITFRTAGPQFLTIADSAGAFSFTSPVDVSGALPTHMVFTQQPSSRVSTRGALGTVTVELKDAFGNTSPVTGILVHVSVPAGAFTLSGGLQQWADGGVATFPDLSIAGHGTTHLIASVAPLQMQDVSSADVQVVDDVAPAKPVLTQTGATETGLTVQWTGVGDDGVQGQLTSQELRYSTSAITTDAAFNAATPVTVAAPVPAGAVQSATLSGLGAGQTYHVALKVTDAHGNSARSDSLAVSTADPQVTQLAFTPQPSNGTAGSVLADVKVSLLDARGDVVPMATTAVTLSLTGQPGFTAVTVAAVNGVATFPGLRVDTAGTFTFTATAGALTKVSQPFTVDAGAAAKLVLAAFTDPIDAGDSVDVSVSATDAYGNILKDYAGTVHFTSSDTQAVLPPDATFTPADQGEKTVSGLVFKTAGTQSLTVTDTATPALTGTVDAEVRASTAASLEVVASAGPFGAGQSLSYELVARDVYGNVAKDYASTVTFSSSDAQAVLPGAYTFTLLDEGRHTFSVELRTAGEQVLVAEDVSEPALTASHHYVILPADVDHLAFDAAPTTGEVREALEDIQVSLRDAHDNRVSATSRDVALTFARGAFPQGRVTRATVDGVATFVGALVTDEGTYQLQAEANGLARVTSPDLIISDTKAPGPVVDFHAYAPSATSITLTWQDSGDDGSLGTAARYDLRYATEAITDADFESATVLSILGAPARAGTYRWHALTDLDMSETYFFALKTFDGAGNASTLALSSVRTPSPCEDRCWEPLTDCMPDARTLITSKQVCVDSPAGNPYCQVKSTKTTHCPGEDGACFHGACTTAPAPEKGELSISEVMHSPSAGRTEYLELRNTSDKLLSIAGLTVTYDNGVGEPLSFTVNPDEWAASLIPPGSFWVLGQDGDLTANGFVPVDHVYGPSFVMGDTGTLSVRHGTTEVDRVVYTHDFPHTPGHAMSLADSMVGTNGSARPWYWCDAHRRVGNGRGDYGSPRQPNGDCRLVSSPAIFCKIHSPKTFPSADGSYPAYILPNTSYDIYTRFSGGSLTTGNPQGNDYYPLLEVQLGYGVDTTLPGDWTWTPASFNPDYSAPGGSNEDELNAVLRIPTLGRYSYGFRYRMPYSGWLYCDQNGPVRSPSNAYGSVSVVASVPPPPLTNHVVISEVSGLHSSANLPSRGGFIELFNPTHEDVDLSYWELLYDHEIGSTGFTGGFGFREGSVIPAHGYFLLGNPTYTGPVAADDAYAFDIAMSGRGLLRLLRPDGLPNREVDALLYGAPNSPECCRAPFAPQGGSLERKALPTSTRTTLGLQGADAVRGNGYDSDNSARDFVVRTERQPQNSQSPREYY